MIIDKKIFQVSTLQALVMGYTKKVITVGELLTHGDVGLGTFEDVNGEMIMLDGHCYRAMEDGKVEEASPDMGVPFSSVEFFHGERSWEVSDIPSMEALKTYLNLKVEEGFGLNSIHVVKVEGEFDRVDARSESAFRSTHVELKDILDKTQRDYHFEHIKGCMVCLYYPDYMQGINASGWHFHFVSDDRTKGGHVFDLVMKNGTVQMDKISKLEIKLPTDPSFDTYELTKAKKDDISKIEQG